jgi:hypothetical protein
MRWPNTSAAPTIPRPGTARKHLAKEADDKLKKTA